VSVRTSEFPNGALRGQLGGATFRATLTGEAEVSATGEPGQGDLDASGSATLTVDAPHGDICWVLRAADIALPASDAHVHQGVAGSNGSAVITLSPPDATGLSTGCVAAPTALLNQIRISPADFYVNIHTSEFPNGAVRGQLAR
jgi:hypothetical protein